MADTRVQHQVENWVRGHLNEVLAESFSLRSVALMSGGQFEFDLVNADGSLVGCISTSGLKTSGGKRGAGKIHKIFADMFFLSLAVGATRHMLVFTEETMYDAIKRQQRDGRVPSTFELRHVELPEDLHEQLVDARRRASKEVSKTTAVEELPDDVLLPGSKS